MRSISHLNSLENQSVFFLSADQVRTDALQNSFSSQASDLGFLAAMSTGTVAFSVGRSVGLSVLSGTLRGSALKLGAWSLALITEVAGFRAANQVLQPQGAEAWYEGQAFANTASDFLVMKGLAVLCGQSGLIFRQSVQASGLVLNESLGESLGFRESQNKNFSERFAHAFTMGLALEVGGQLSQRLGASRLQSLSTHLEVQSEMRQTTHVPEGVSSRVELCRAEEEIFPKEIAITEILGQLGRGEEAAVQERLDADLSLLYDFIDPPFPDLKPHQEKINAYLAEQFNPARLVEQARRDYPHEMDSDAVQCLFAIAKLNSFARAAVHGFTINSFTKRAVRSEIPKGLKYLYKLANLEHPGACKALANVCVRAEARATEGDRAAMVFLTSMAMSYSPAALALGKAAMRQEFALRLFRMRNLWDVAIASNSEWVRALEGIDESARFRLPRPRYWSEVVNTRLQTITDEVQWRMAEDAPENEFREGSLVEITDEFRDFSTLEIDLGDSEISTLVGEMMTQLREAPGTRIFHITWVGSERPYGLRIMGYNVMNFSHNQVMAYNAEGQLAEIGVYTPWREYDGAYELEHSGCVYFIQPFIP